MFGAVLDAECAERPSQRIVAAVVEIKVEGFEARPFGQELPPAMRCASVGSRPCRNAMAGVIVER